MGGRVVATSGAMIAVFAFWLVPSAGAAAFAVNSTADAVDATPGDGTCATAPPAVCTLRGAVQEANALPGPDEITLPAGEYKLTITGAGEDAAAKGDLDVTGELSIVGAGARTTTIDRSSSLDDRVLDVLTGDLALASITVKDGTGGVGGNIRAAAPLELTDVAVSRTYPVGHVADEGGGIWASAAVDLNRVAVTNNSATNGGGVVVSGPLTAVNTTIANNYATNGGGLDVLPGGSADLTNVTFSRNEAQGPGSQALNAGSINVRNTVFAGDIGTYGVNCGGSAPVSAGSNVDDDGSCALAAAGDSGFRGLGWMTYKPVDGGGETDVVPNFAIPYPITDYGNGPAVDIGATGCPATDQRGVARPQGASCDAGAYEATFADLVLTAIGVPQNVAGGESIRYSLLVRNDGPTTVGRPHLTAWAGNEASVAVPSMGGVPCPDSDCQFGPLAPGAVARVDIEQGTTDRGPHPVALHAQVINASDYANWSIDPNPGNSEIVAMVNVGSSDAPSSVTGPVPAPKLAPLSQPCARKKTGSRRNDVLIGTALGDRLLGGRGNDRLNGRAGDDCLDGGAGNDRLTGGSGKDKLFGGPGDDVINAADHERDIVDCGKGRDRGTFDRIDRVKGCEKVTRRR